MSEWKSGDVNANGLRLHYTRTGGEKPPLLLAHGFSDDGLCWSPFAEALESDYDIIMVDARGHGLSEAPEQGYSTLAHAQDLADVIHALSLDRPYILGHSMGAGTALMLAGIFPDLPRAILLEDPGAGWMPPAEPAPGKDRNGMRDWVTSLKDKTQEELIAAQHAAAPRWSNAELVPWAESKLRLSPHLLNRRSADPVDWAAILRQITCPVLLIRADPDQGALISAQSASVFQSLVPQAEVAFIADAGHNIRREQFAEYLSGVRRFLQEVACD